MDWDDLRILLAASRAGSFAGAARRLKLTHSTVLRRLGRLEAELGTRLFLRVPEGLSPTPAGEALALRAERIETEALAAEREAAGRAPGLAGTVRITAPDDVAAVLLPPVLSRLRRELPELRLDVEVSNALADLARREADVALRATARPPEAMAGRRLGRLEFALYASARYLRGRPPPAPGALEGHDLLGPGDSLGLAAAARWMERHAPRPVLRVNSFLHLAQAAHQGLGLALLPCFVGDAEPGLRRTVPVDGAIEDELWALAHPDQKRSPRVRAVIEAAVREIAPKLRRSAG